MAVYYKNHLSTAPIVPFANASSATSTSTSAPGHAMSEFDKHRETLLLDDLEEGWASELCRYLNTMQRDVKKNTDIVEWCTCNCYPQAFILGLSPTYMINVYGPNPTTQKTE
jgi:hypothetical protein